VSWLALASITVVVVMAAVLRPPPGPWPHRRDAAASRRRVQLPRRLPTRPVRRRQCNLEALIQLVEDTARGMRTGSSMVAAVAVAASCCPDPALAGEWNRVVSEVSSGRSLADAIDRWRRRSPDGPVSLVAAAMSLGQSVGGQRARALESVAASLRAQRSVHLEISAQAAQARLSAVVMVLAPAGFGALTVVADGATRTAVLGSNAGRVCLFAGVLLDLLGWWWMQHLVGRAVQP
jgi:tight adherence protein B